MTIFVLGTACYAYNCISCGVAFTVPQVVADKQRQDGGYHTCPNGHSQGWGKGQTENDLIRQERDRLKQRTARLEEEAIAAQRQLEAERKKTAHLKKRAAAGVCPCCNRAVRQMALHMKTKHPNYNVVHLKGAST